MTRTELLLIRDLLESLLRKCVTDALHRSTRQGLDIINRELGLKEIQEGF